MKKTIATVFLMAGLCLAGYSDASAQTASAVDTRAFVVVNVLAQPATRNIDITQDFTLYGETIPSGFTSSQHIGNGAIIDFGGGYNITDRFAAGLDISVFSKSSTSAVAAAIPDPLFFNRAKPFAVTTGDLSHREVGVNLQLRYTYPVRDNIDVVVAGGPSIFHVSQDLVPTVTVAPGTQTATASVSSESKSAFGGNIGVEGNYYFNRMWGAGLVIRYAGAKTDLPSFSGLSVGGFQIGVGARVRF
jgi:hypothetical protein